MYGLMATHGALLPILLIERYASVREPLQWFLEMHGYGVVALASASQAVTELRAGLRPGLILLDVIARGRRGLPGLRRHLRASGLSDVPVVVYSDDERSAVAPLIDAVAYLRLPEASGTLLESVRAHYPRRGR